MKPDTARTCCAFALVTSVCSAIALAAYGVGDFETYLAIILLAILAGFIGATQDD